MSKQIIMTIPNFMEMQRGNKTIKDIINNNIESKNSKIKLDNMKLQAISAVLFFSSIMANSNIPTDQTITQVTKDGVTIMYVTVTVLLQCFYELATKTATIL